MFNAIYKFDAYQFNTTNYYTNKTWVDAYRGAGRPEATYAIERLMDELAAEVGVDPLEIREMNWIKHEEFPFTTVAGMTYDSGNYEAATARAKEMFGYDELRAEQQRRRESGRPGAARASASRRSPRCAAWRRHGSSASSTTPPAAGSTPTSGCSPTGKVEVVTGTSPHGQGHETAWSQIVADRLGVPFEDVEVLHGDTQVSHRGMDTYGSRSLVVGAEAVVKAADKVIEKAKHVAAHLLEASEDDLEFSRREVQRQGHRQGRRRSRTSRCTPFHAHDLPDGAESIDASATFDPDNFSFPHGTHLCAMEVDTETGATTMRKYVAVDDIGTIINPLIVSGQVHGGLVQGIAQALWEEAVYDDAGTLVTGSFVDYTLPTAADTISFEIDHTTSPSTYTQLGTKGVGEAGTIASTPAVVNAIVDALRPMGVNDIRMPCTPERVFRAIQTAGKGGATAAGGRSRTSTPTHPTPIPPPARPREVPSDPGTSSTTRRRRPSRRRWPRSPGRDDAKVIAGGQSLLPVLRMRLNAPELVVDLGRIESLRGIREDGDAIVIGATTTYQQLLDDPLVHEHLAAAGEGDRDRRRPADPAPRHPRRRALARRPGRRPRRSGAGARRDDGDHRLRRRARRWRRPTSSPGSSRPRSARTSCSPRSGSRSTPGGGRTTRSSCGCPTSGRSSRSPRRSRPTAARSPRRASG